MLTIPIQSGKYGFIKTYRSTFAVKKMCQVLKVSRSARLLGRQGYYDWFDRPESQRSVEDEALLTKIKRIHKNSFETYGSPRITEELNENGYTCSRPKVARLMRKNDIWAKTKKKFKITTNSDHFYPIAPNLLKQDFWTNSVNRIWVVDITYIRTWEGWLYLTVILDLFNRKVVV